MALLRRSSGLGLSSMLLYPVPTKVRTCSVVRWLGVDLVGRIRSRRAEMCLYIYRLSLDVGDAAAACFTMGLLLVCLGIRLLIWVQMQRGP